jgi:putative ABC transport system substrate-binding protein
MRRRDFITLVGGAAAAPVLSPLAARAQQPSVRVIGLLNGVSFAAYADRVAAFRQGLKETGFVEGQNVAIEYRSADGQYDRLPALAADLMRLPVAVIVAIGGTNAARAAMAATSTIPIVFAVGNDPVESGLVASLNRPAANVTGVTLNNVTLSPKRLELLRKLVPNAAVIGFLLNPGSPASEADARELPVAARTLGLELVVLRAGTKQEIDTAFATIVQQRVAAVVVENDAFLNSQAGQIAELAARYALPAIYGSREYAVRGGLISYGPNINDMYRQAGTYTGRILKGEKPSDLPVMQPVKFEFVLNLKTAKALGINVPPTLLTLADEVIE